jgi:hypothetical protein
MTDEARDEERNAQMPDTPAAKTKDEAIKACMEQHVRLLQCFNNQSIFNPGQCRQAYSGTLKFDMPV